MALPPSKAYVDPYLYAYNPRSGTLAGAAQDYGSQVNWLGADVQLVSKIAELQARRNHMLGEWNNQRPGLIGPLNSHGGTRGWDASRIIQRGGVPLLPPAEPSTAIETLTDRLVANEGVQLTGKGFLPPQDGRRYRKRTRDGFPFPHNWEVWDPAVNMWKLVEDKGVDNSMMGLGSWYFPKSVQLGGEHLSNNRFVSLLERPNLPRQGGVGPYQFSVDFPPYPYGEPFSNYDMADFPAFFSPLYDPANPSRPFQGF